MEQNDKVISHLENMGEADQSESLQATGSTFTHYEERQGIPEVKKGSNRLSS